MNIEVSNHAKEQFANRYPNLELSEHFINHIANNSIKQAIICKSGNLIINKNRGIYRTIFKGQNIEFVLSKHKNGKYVIVTFNTPPQSIFDNCYSYIKEQQ